MDKKLKRRLDLLTGYAVLSLLAFGYLAFSSFNHAEKKETLDELTVKKINLTGEDGSLRMVMSNETRQHPGRAGGKDLPKRPRPAGLIFFDNEGNEVGGLTYGIERNNPRINHGLSFTMDNYQNDQVVQMVDDETYENGKSDIRRGFVINEFPVGSNLADLVEALQSVEKIADTTVRAQKKKELFAKNGGKRRVFMGRSADNDAGLFLYDSDGKPKLKIYVSEDGEPKFEILGKNGQFKNMIDGK